ncbi:hypothetical protein ACFL27_08775, partial [candidate division CSSED10-310 bacterium]
MIGELRQNLKLKGVYLKNFLNLEDDEKRLVLSWRNSDQIRFRMYTCEEIKWEEHQRFIKSLAEDNTRLYYLAFIDQNPVGVLYFTEINIRHKRGIYGIHMPD